VALRILGLVQRINGLNGCVRWYFKFELRYNINSIRLFRQSAVLNNKRRGAEVQRRRGKRVQQIRVQRIFEKITTKLEMMIIIMKFKTGNHSNILNLNAICLNFILNSL
jgi:hypothetical protein